MPEVQPEKNLVLHKQVEIRRPSERGHYFDIVWIKATLAQKGHRVVDDAGVEWTIAEVYGTRARPSFRVQFGVGGD